MTARVLLEELAKKLRSRAKWEEPGYYDQGVEADIKYAKRDLYECLASDLEELALAAEET